MKTVWNPDDNNLELVAKQCLAPILSRTLTAKRLRELCDGYNLHYSRRTPKDAMSYNIAKTWLKTGEETSIEPYLQCAESLYFIRLYGDPSRGISPDKHNPGLYTVMLNNIARVRHFLQTKEFSPVNYENSGEVTGSERKSTRLHQIEDKRFKTSFLSGDRSSTL